MIPPCDGSRGACIAYCIVGLRNPSMSIEVVGDMVPAGMPATFAIESLQVQEQEQFQEVQKAKVQVESEGEGEEKSKQKVQPGREKIAEPVTVVTGGDHNKLMIHADLSLTHT